ncbi:MAG TPA: hypothetical protein VHT71_24815, partial [Methylomirabilota bacterium]|nr:hypothetical protein [Methylomirabilota bacterium]
MKTAPIGPGSGPRDDARALNDELTRAHERADLATGQKDRLAAALEEARQEIVALREEVDKLSSPPASYGIFLSSNIDGTVNLLTSGRKLKVNIHPGIKTDALKPGQELILNEGLNVIEAAGYEVQGDVV